MPNSHPSIIPKYASAGPFWKCCRSWNLTYLAHLRSSSSNILSEPQESVAAGSARPLSRTSSQVSRSLDSRTRNLRVPLV